MKKQKKNTRPTIIEQVAETQREILSLVDRRFGGVETRLDSVEGKLDTTVDLLTEIHEVIAGDLARSPSLQEQVRDLGVRMERLEKRIAKSA